MLPKPRVCGERWYRQSRPHGFDPMGRLKLCVARLSPSPRFPYDPDLAERPEMSVKTFRLVSI